MYIQCICVIVVMKISSFFIDFLINTVKKLPCSTICRDVCNIEFFLQETRKGNCTRTRHGQQ
jgi:hypothetical protein